MTWTSQYAALHRALADGDFDSFPRPANAGLEAACACWGTLHYALNCLLGWKHVGHGLSCWYGDGKPTEDSPVLKLIQHVWGFDDLLDYYAAWAWKPTDAGWLHTQSDDPFQGPSPTWLARHSLWPHEEWWRRFVRRGRVHHHDPFYGGSDPLHLSIHTGREATTPSRTHVLHIDRKLSTCVLITDGIQHYLADLMVLHQRLPSLGDRSWRVEVFDRRAGWLGVFRRSRETGRWFVGQHSVHMMGES